ncbi:hypothetical protein SAMN06297251_107101 [Fulvimarina manganoxydans]|uniref:Uncharacterized protein n=1 Tax=Fulvimarina manganoxydans TaxID=937218 RepID=A0A1W2BT22_9HYPH|nr:hypothetical protein [Fulvimarina manganoxydans]SMC75742.1 hypothetical protein SAMN06297251_107101 [Fulvimarina manganoxydans]
MRYFRGLLRGSATLCLLPALALAPAMAQDGLRDGAALAAPLQPSSARQELVDIGSLFALTLPYAFDFAVSVGRSFAIVSYGTRRYDQITDSFVITDLRIARGDFQMAIDQLRIAPTETIIEGFAIDTRALPLDPTVRAVLERLDKEILNLKSSIVSDVAPSSGDVRFSMTVSGDEVARLEVAADLRRFHLLAPIEGVTPPGQDVQFAGQLVTARGDLTDAGLVEAITTTIGEKNDLDAVQARDMASAMAGIAIASMFASLPGGSTSELDGAAQSWSVAVQEFLRDPDRLSIRLDPARPFDLAAFNDGEVLAADVLALRPSVTNGPVDRVPLISNAAATSAADDPAREEALSFALIEGRGLPQDIPRAVAMLEPRLLSGDMSAASSLARALVLNPGAEMSQEALSRIYEAVLLARADRNGVEPSLTETLTKRLSPAEIAVAEAVAAESWRQSESGRQADTAETASLAARDWAALRRLAYAYYEGIGRPRNLQRAYALANIAAAGDDKAARLLRDKLARARATGDVIWPEDETGRLIASLWDEVLPQPADSAGEGASPESARSEGSSAPEDAGTNDDEEETGAQ